MQQLKLIQLLKQKKEFILVNEKQLYKQITVSNTGDIKLRHMSYGTDIGTKRQIVVEKGMFIYSRLGAHEGAFGIVPEALDGGIVTGDMPVFYIDTKLIYPDFLIMCLKLPKVRESLIKLTKGRAQTRIRENQFLDIAVEIPDLDTQKRLLRKQQQIQNELKKLNFEALTKSLSLLKYSILQEALQGKLVSQNMNEPALEINGKSVQNKDFPQNWRSYKLKELGKITGGGTPSMNNSNYWNGDIVWISPKDFIKRELNDSELKITKMALENSSAKLIPQNSILIVGRSGILKRKIPIAINTVDCAVNQDIKVIIPHVKEMTNYLVLLLEGNEKELLSNYVKTGATVQSLKYDEFENFEVMVPPLKEQIRIVKKVDELMKIYNKLEIGIKEGQNSSEKLMGSLLLEAFKNS